MITTSCDDSWPQNAMLPASVDFSITLNSTNINKVVGVALNGVFLHPGISELGYDAFYPKAYATQVSPQSIDPDLCLGSSTYSSSYHYYMFSPCILEQKIKHVSSECSSNSKCNNDKIKYTLQLMSSDLKGLIPVGLAKDGRIIYGPYNSNG
jgi:hypothetical protein